MSANAVHKPATVVRIFETTLSHRCTSTWRCWVHGPHQTACTWL